MRRVDLAVVKKAARELRGRAIFGRKMLQLNVFGAAELSWRCKGWCIQVGK